MAKIEALSGAIKVHRHLSAIAWLAGRLLRQGEMFSRFPLIPVERGSLLAAAPVIRKLEEYRQLVVQPAAIVRPAAFSGRMVLCLCPQTLPYCRGTDRSCAR
jgi:hypothetical protein